MLVRNKIAGSSLFLVAAAAAALGLLMFVIIVFGGTYDHLYEIRDIIAGVLVMGGLLFAAFLCARLGRRWWTATDSLFQR